MGLKKVKNNSRRNFVYRNLSLFLGLLGAQKVFAKIKPYSENFKLPTTKQEAAEELVKAANHEAFVEFTEVFLEKLHGDKVKFQGQTQFYQQTVRFYMENFSLEELQQFLSFYQSPLGKKHSEKWLQAKNYFFLQEAQRINSMYPKKSV